MQKQYRVAHSGRKPALFHDFLDLIYREVLEDRTGEVAGYIPELLSVNPDDFGIAITTVDGHVYQVGDSLTRFSIQSVSKAFTYGIALQDKGEAQVISKVDVEPSGEAFNSISLEDETGRPRNPMINAGAIAVTGLINGETSDEKIERILKVFADYTGHKLDYDEKIYRSEKHTGHRNRAISHMLRSYDILESDPEATLDAYFRQCSIKVTCRDLAVMGACLANNGVNPITGVRTLNSRYIPHVLSTMASCGMYDYSGNWIYQVGMPAKSGVGGGIVAVLPGQLGLAVYSPRLDQKGNSVRGLAVCERLSSDLGLHMLQTSRVSSSTVIRSMYTAEEVHSLRDRHPRSMEALSNHGAQIQVVELMGELTFVSSEIIVQRLEQKSETLVYLILDFNRVTGIEQSAGRIFCDLLRRFNSRSQQVLFVGQKIKYSLADISRDDLNASNAQALFKFHDISRALEWCEDELLSSLDMEEKPETVFPLSHQTICTGMTAEEVDFLDSLMEDKCYQAGDIICREGEPAELVYFVISGKVSAEIRIEGKRSTWLSGCSQGGVVGESALLGDKVRSADLVADSDARLKQMKAQELLNNTHSLAPQVIQKFFRNLSSLYDQRLRRTTGHIRALS